MLKNRVNGLAVASAFESAGSAVGAAAIFRPSPMSEISKPTQVGIVFQVQSNEIASFF